MRRSCSIVLLPIAALLPKSCSAPAPACALPPPGFHASTDEIILRDFRGIELPLVSAVTIRAGRGIAYNDAPASLEQVDQYIRMGAQLTPQPFVTVDFDRGADCATIDHVRRTIDRSFECTTNDRCLQGPRPAWTTG